jgi:hypothetical protein
LMDFGQTKLTCANYFLMPGYIFAPDVPTVISSVLGSSVSVCLFDRKRNMGGMNHFLVPLAQKAQNLTPRFGNVATLALIRLMIQAGSQNGTWRHRFSGEHVTLSDVQKMWEPKMSGWPGGCSCEREFEWSRKIRVEKRGGRSSSTPARTK